jgi:hypothetical protein
MLGVKVLLLLLLDLSLEGLVKEGHLLFLRRLEWIRFGSILLFFQLKSFKKVIVLQFFREFEEDLAFNALQVFRLNLNLLN